MEEFDVCVIGTGAGGGVMLQGLTAAGWKVIGYPGPGIIAGIFAGANAREGGHQAGGGLIVSK